MAEVVKRTWRSGARRVKRTSWGYTLQVNGKQVRRFDAAWSEEDAQKALAARILEVDVPTAPSESTLTFGAAIARYLVAKARKRSIEDDRKHLERLRDAFGAA